MHREVSSVGQQQPANNSSGSQPRVPHKRPNPRESLMMRDTGALSKDGRDDGGPTNHDANFAPFKRKDFTNTKMFRSYRKLASNYRCHCHGWRPNSQRADREEGRSPAASARKGAARKREDDSNSKHIGEPHKSTCVHAVHVHVVHCSIQHTGLRMHANDHLISE